MSRFPILLALVGGCSAPTGVAGPTDPDPTGDGGTADLLDDTAAPEESGSDVLDDPGDSSEPDPVDTGYVVSDPALLTRGEAWVRQNRPFVSGLTPHMGGPPAAEVDRYYDSFHATAAHLWEDGLPNTEATWAAAVHPDHRWLSWVNASGASEDGGQIIGGVGANPPGRVGYQVGDEPLDWTDVDTIDAGVAAVRTADPAGLIVVNLGTPSDGSISTFTEFADHFASDPEVDVLSYDLYSTGYGEYERLEIIRASAQAHGKPYWRYLRSYDDVGDSDWPLESDLRWDAYVGLVYGYTGLSWFLYEAPAWTSLQTAFFDGSGSWSHTPNARFDVAADLNAKVEQYLRVISQLTSTEVCFIPTTPVYRPTGTHGWAPGAGGDPFLASIQPTNLRFLQTQDTLVGFFRDDRGEPYVMVQNPHRESSNWPVWLYDDADFRLTFDFSGSLVDPTHLQRFDPVTGTAHDLPLVATGPSTAELVVTLEAGDALLFKYATGQSFAMQ